MKKYIVTATETIFYEKIVEAEDEDRAYEVFVGTTTEEDIVDSCNFEVDEVEEVVDDE